MSDQYNKNYISAREFINSWEKEIYELTYLDYFIYLLINDLSSLLENNFYNSYPENDIFRLSNEEIATMSFNIGDALQIFLDKNCFNGCTLGCPNKLSKPFTLKDDEIREYFVKKEFDGVTASCTNREDCLYYDVKNYVVMDLVLDFYNYDMGVVLHEKDRNLSKLLEIIMGQIIGFTKDMGPNLLINPADLAGELFEKHFLSDESSWEEIIPDEDDIEEEGETESWKIDHKSLNSVFQEFEEEFSLNLDSSFSRKLMKHFKAFLDDYVEVNKINEIEFEFIDEFFSMLLLQNFLLDENVDFKEVKKLFNQFFQFVDHKFSTNLNDPFTTYSNNELPEIERLFFVTQKYQNEHTYVNYLLNVESMKENLIEGYYEIVKWTDEGSILFDVDVKTEHNNIDLGELAKYNIKIGDILHLQLDTANSVWQIAFLELIYPSSSKIFLY